MTKRTIVNKLQTLGVQQFSKDLCNITWSDTGHSIQVNFWNVDVVFPCKYNSEHTDAKMMSVDLLYRKNDSIHANSYCHYFRDVSDVSIKDFMSLETIIDFMDMIRDNRSVGLRLTKGA